MKENGCGFVGEIAALRLQGDTLHSLTLGRYDGSERKNEVIRPVRRAVGGAVLK